MQIPDIPVSSVQEVKVFYNIVRNSLNLRKLKILPFKLSVLTLVFMLSKLGRVDVFVKNLDNSISSNMDEALATKFELSDTSVVENQEAFAVLEKKFLTNLLDALLADNSAGHGEAGEALIKVPGALCEVVNVEVERNSFQVTWLFSHHPVTSYFVQLFAFL